MMRKRKFTCVVVPSRMALSKGREALEARGLGHFAANTPGEEAPLEAWRSELANDLPYPMDIRRGEQRELQELAGMHQPPEKVAFRTFSPGLVQKAFLGNQPGPLKEGEGAVDEGAERPAPDTPKLATEGAVTRSQGGSVMPCGSPIEVLKEMGVTEEVASSGDPKRVLQELYRQGTMKRAFEKVLDLALMRLDPEGEEAKAIIGSKRAQRAVAALGLGLREKAFRDDDVFEEEYKDALKSAVSSVAERLPESASRDAKRFHKRRKADPSCDNASADKALTSAAS